MDEDEWFFNSFKRYYELQMFDFPNAVQEIDLTSTDNLCVALRDENGKNRNEILVLFLPSSLHTTKSIEGLKLDRHLSFDHGYFTSSRLFQIKCVPNEEKLFISEKAGLALYDISCSESDIIRKIADVPSAISDVRLAVNGMNHYLVHSSTVNNLKTIVNFESMKVLLSIDDELTSTENATLPFFTSAEIISFGDTVKGQIVSYDIRDGKQVNTITGLGNSAHWTFDTKYNIKRQTISDTNEIFSFSTNGDFLVYDIRKPSCPAIQARHDLVGMNNSASANVQMHVCPMNLNLFSVCGFDENLYVCELSQNTVKVLFTHDGHSYGSEEFEPNVRTICSLWLPFVSENTLVSCANNSSVHCWQFKIS